MISWLLCKDKINIKDPTGHCILRNHIKSKDKNSDRNNFIETIIGGQCGREFTAAIDNELDKTRLRNNTEPKTKYRNWTLSNIHW